MFIENLIFLTLPEEESRRSRPSLEEEETSDIHGCQMAERQTTS